MPIRAVLWDIDDTIFDYSGADRVGMRRHLEIEGLPAAYTSPDHALDVWKAVTDVHWARFAEGELDFPGQRRERVRAFLGKPLGDAEADAWFGRHAAHYEAAWTLFPDTVPVLDLLADAYRHAVLSNSSIHHQDRKLRALGVRDRFEAVVCAVELGVSKPDAGAFPAGLTGIWLDREGRGGRPELVRITGLHELPGLLAGDTRFGAPDTFR